MVMLLIILSLLLLFHSLIRLYIPVYYSSSLSLSLLVVSLLSFDQFFLSCSFISVRLDSIILSSQEYILAILKNLISIF